MPEERMAYIDRSPCGCVMGAVVDSPEHRKDVARFCAETVKGGGTLERVTCAAVREMPWNCSAHSSTADEVAE